MSLGFEIKNIISKEAFSNDESLFKAWANAKEQVRKNILEELLQQHTLKKNIDLKEVVASTNPSSEPTLVVNNNYLESFLM